ncbi:MAG: HD-GYP domain-containing protein [Deferrisomatales bacterium]
MSGFVNRWLPMKQQVSVDLGNLLLSLSDAMDLAHPHLVRHQQRVAYVAMKLARTLEQGADQERRIFAGALLHDIGAFSIEEKLALCRAEREDTEPHCARGALLLSTVPCLRSAAPVVRHHHRPWSAWDRDLGDPDVLAAQVVLLADYAERLLDRETFVLHQHHHVWNEVQAASGSLIHPDVVGAFLACSRAEEFWLDLVSPRLYSLLLHEGPYERFHVGLDWITTVTGLFKDIIDFRSRFTATHSTGVAECARLLSSLFGLTATESRLMEIAGHLHDLGKLHVPDAILNKPSGLTNEEMAVMKSHTYHTYSVIQTIGGLTPVAEWAAFHHERLDGAGYPFRCRAEDLSTGARIMAVADIFTATAEDRPYRKGMSTPDIARALQSFAKRGLIDQRVTELLLDHFDDVRGRVLARQAAALDIFQSRFSSADAR